MNGISAKTFNVQLFAQDATSSRAVRRVIVNADLLKSAKLSAGDVLALSPIGNPLTSKNQVRTPIPLAVAVPPISSLSGSDDLFFPLSRRSLLTIPSQ